MTCTEYFHPVLQFESLLTLNTLLKTCTDKRLENILLKKIGHLHQCDMASLMPFECYMMVRWMPQTTTNETYLLNSKLILSYLARINLNNSFNSDEVDLHIRQMESKWIDYDIKLWNKAYQPPTVDNV